MGIYLGVDSNKPVKLWMVKITVRLKNDRQVHNLPICTIVREYVFYVFLKIQKNATFCVFLKRL